MADRDQLDRGFSRLEPEARALIVLHHYLDLPLPEVAIALGIPLGTAKSRLHRALQSMRAALDADARPRSEIPEGRLGMTLNDGFDRTVSDWLDEQAGHGMPDYLDETLARTTRTRQRPWWSSLERWLPVQTTLRFAPALPGVAWLAGRPRSASSRSALPSSSSARRHRTPAPFGLARQRRDPVRRDRRRHPRARPGDGHHGHADHRSGGRSSARCSRRTAPGCSSFAIATSGSESATRADAHGGERRRQRRPSADRSRLQTSARSMATPPGHTDGSKRGRRRRAADMAADGSSLLARRFDEACGPRLPGGWRRRSYSPSGRATREVIVPSA